MAEKSKEDRLNITIVALVALVAIVSLAAIVLNGHVRAQNALQTQIASAPSSAGGSSANSAGDARALLKRQTIPFSPDIPTTTVGDNVHDLSDLACLQCLRSCRRNEFLVQVDCLEYCNDDCATPIADSGNKVGTLSDGETATFTVDGVDYEVTMNVLKTFALTTPRFKFMVNGEFGDTIGLGEFTTYSNNIMIGVTKVDDGKISFVLGHGIGVKGVLHEGESRIVKIDGQAHELTLSYVGPETSTGPAPVTKIEVAKFLVDGDMTPSLRIDDAVALKCGSIHINDILHGEPGVVEFSYVGVTCDKPVDGTDTTR